MPSKQYRAIGWVVEWRGTKGEEWFAHSLDIRPTKQGAIDLFTGAGQSYEPKWRMRRGLARVVRVYVEVKG